MTIFFISVKKMYWLICVFTLSFLLTDFVDATTKMHSKYLKKNSLSSVQKPLLPSNMVDIPAEWRVKQSGTWLGWPIFTTLPNKPVSDLLLEMMGYITDGNLTDQNADYVYLSVTDNAMETEARNAIKFYNSHVVPVYNKTPIVESRVLYFHMPRTDLWFRDYLLFGWDTNTGNVSVVNYDFNAWGMGGEYLTTSVNPNGQIVPEFLRVSNYFNSIASTDTQLATKIAFKTNMPIINSWLKMEPGGFEFNDESDFLSPSRKRLIVGESYLTQPERNYGSTIYKVLDEIKRVIPNLDDIIVLPKFKYNLALGREEVETMCPLDINVALANTTQWSKCLDYKSYYYLDHFGGGLLVDDSVFTGTIDNEDDMLRREDLGYSHPIYNNALNSITTNGHTDEYVRWIGENTVLLSYVPGGENAPSNSIAGRTWFRLETIKDFLLSKGIQIIRIPTPPEKVEYLGSPMCAYTSLIGMKFTSGTYYDYSTNTRLPAKDVPILSIYPKNTPIPFYAARSYLNFIVTDKYVIMPKYNDNVTIDTEAYNVIKNVFEGDIALRTGINRRVVQIENVDRLNFCGGGMHCISQQQPLPKHEQ